MSNEGGPVVAFEVVEHRGGVARAEIAGHRNAFLVTNSWDDWFKFETTFDLIISDPEQGIVEAGEVKIGRRGLEGASRDVAVPGMRYPNPPARFERLPGEFFSLGQSENYYETLQSLGREVARDILTALNDCALDLEHFERNRSEPSMRISLLRDVTGHTVRERFHKIARGESEQSAYQFSIFIDDSHEDSSKLDFEVTPGSVPPTNVHAVIGRNGVGKTRLLHRIAKSLVADGSDALEEVVSVVPHGSSRFAGIVSVSFSAFDELRGSTDSMTDGLPHKAIGLPMRQADAEARLGAWQEDLTQDFLKGISACRKGLRPDLWTRAVAALENDPLFQEAELRQLVRSDDWVEHAERVFPRLSSGHAIVALTIAKLIEYVDERTLVLFDEPESHLHPPLLSAFVRAISDLMKSRNGVAVLATHSPVVLQEIPQNCVWKLRRSGRSSRAERPTRETYGENTGTLTREVFGLEATTTGFHKQIYDVALSTESPTYENIVAQFDGQLGDEARALIHIYLDELGRTDTSVPF